MDPTLPQQNLYIAGDWGNSHLRLSLMDAATGLALVQACGPGIKSVSKDSLPKVLAELTLGWRKLHPSIPIILCGMAGSNIGWVDAGYVQCPLEPGLLPNHLTYMPTELGIVTIVPGIKCLSPTGTADMMRGEETQILGALTGHPDLCQGQHLLCLPGTHTKWVWLENGTVKSFITSICGELYALLSQHSLLVKKDDPAATDEGCAFADGVARSVAHPSVDLLQLLFEARSRQLNGTLASADANSFMSGLIISRDIASATSLFKALWHRRQSIIFIGKHRLAVLYLAAAKRLGSSGEAMDGDDMSRAGIHAIYLDTQTRQQHHAS